MFTEEYLTDCIRGLTLYIYTLSQELKKSNTTLKRRKEIKEIINYENERIRKICKDLKKKKNEIKNFNR